MHILQGHQRLDFVKQYYCKGRILDAACGQGAFAIALAQDTDNKVYAIDINDSPLRHHASIHFEQMSVFDIPKNYGLFDTILFMEVIEHLEDPRVAIELLHDHLAYEGAMLITTPWVPDWDYETDHIWRYEDIESINELLQGMFHISWKDNIFLYGVVRSLNDRSFTSKT